MPGADALIGTRFLASDEALTSAAAKAKLVAARGDDTIRTRVFDIVRNLDWPALYTGRALQNAFSRQWHRREPELEKSLPTEAPRYARAAAANDLDTSVQKCTEFPLLSVGTRSPSLGRNSGSRFRGWAAKNVYFFQVDLRQCEHCRGASLPEDPRAPGGDVGVTAAGFALRWCR
jgi:hypothetical protein